MRAREAGLFRDFRTPSRLVSTFPSISDIAWHEIFGLLPPRGYQRIYFSNALNTVVGRLFDAISPIEYEHRMDEAFGGEFHHLGAYLFRETIAAAEVDESVRRFLTLRDRHTAYFYNVGPDALQHTRGDLDGYLRHLDRRLEELQGEYRRRTGRPLEIVVLSDHGHNRASDARTLDLAAALTARGFRVGRSLTDPRDVVFSVDGLTTGFGIFCRPDAAAALASALVGVDGVDLVTRRVDATTFEVRSRAGLARIDWRRTRGRETFRYAPSLGDPLGQAAIVAAMRAAGDADAEGFADVDSWVRHTATAAYPVAVVRIVRGHTDVTLNPAPILVSMSDAVRVASGTAGFALQFRPLGGTHGSLAATNALGVVMTNLQETRDDLTGRVSAQLSGLTGLRPLARGGPYLRLLTEGALSRDRLDPFWPTIDLDAVDDPRPTLELLLPTPLPEGATGGVQLKIRLHGPIPGAAGPLLRTITVPVAEWWISPDRLALRLPVADLALDPLRPGIDVVVEARVPDVSDRWTTTRARSDESGRIYPF